MLTIKEFANLHGKSVQAVYQQIKSKENAAALEGHIVKQKINNKATFCLDDEAVRILTEASNQSVQVMEQQDQSARIKELEQEKEQLLIKTADLAARLAELAEWKAENAVAIAAAEQQQQLLTTTQTDLDQAKKDLLEMQNALENKNALLEIRKEAVDQLQKQLDEEIARPLTWKERFTGRKIEKQG